MECPQAVNILKQHNRRYAHGHKGDTFMTGRVGPIDPSRTRKVMWEAFMWLIRNKGGNAADQAVDDGDCLAPTNQQTVVYWLLVVVSLSMACMHDL